MSGEPLHGEIAASPNSERLHPRKADISRPPATASETIAETKKKGFDGVDFSYDVFGAPSGQDPVKISEQVRAKERAEKPKVLVKQKQLLTERYALDCRSQPSMTMTNGKPQPLGPTTSLKTGMTWEKLSGLDAEEIKGKKPSIAPCETRGGRHGLSRHTN